MKRFGTSIVLGLLALLISPASRPAQAATELAEISVKVPAGETVTLEVLALGLERGEPFPEAVRLTADKASIDARRLLKAAALTGALQDDPLQTQLALWRALEGEWSVNAEEVDIDLATALFAAAPKQNTAPIDARGIPLNAALRDGSVLAEVVGWEALEAEPLDAGDEPYQGRATLELKNGGDEDLLLYLPLGLVLEAEDEGEQNMGIASVDGRSMMASALAEAADEADEEATDDVGADEAADEGAADASDGASDSAASETGADDDATDEGASETADEGSSDESDGAGEAGTEAGDSALEPGELPVTGLPAAPDALLAMILGALVLTTGVLLRRA